MADWLGGSSEGSSNSDGSNPMKGVLPLMLMSQMQKSGGGSGAAGNPLLSMALMSSMNKPRRRKEQRTTVMTVAIFGVIIAVVAVICVLVIKVVNGKNNMPSLGSLARNHCRCAVGTKKSRDTGAAAPLLYSFSKTSARLPLRSFRLMRSAPPTRDCQLSFPPTL